jgi:hypothetical protein
MASPQQVAGKIAKRAVVMATTFKIDLPGKFAE